MHLHNWLQVRTATPAHWISITVKSQQILSQVQAKFARLAIRKCSGIIQKTSKSDQKSQTKIRDLVKGLLEQTQP